LGKEGALHSWIEMKGAIIQTKLHRQTKNKHSTTALPNSSQKQYLGLISSTTKLSIALQKIAWVHIQIGPHKRFEEKTRTHQITN